MFSKESRYNYLDNILAIDARGRSMLSKCMRPLPRVTGTFLHVVKENDRLDHLAHKYYHYPWEWWRICDANAAFRLPLALLGKDPVVTTKFPVTYIGSTKKDRPPWHKLLTRLSKKTGIKDVHIRGTTVMVTYNRLDITVEAITKIIQEKESGFYAGEPVTVGRTGKQIVIPPYRVE